MRRLSSSSALMGGVIGRERKRTYNEPIRSFLPSRIDRRPILTRRRYRLKPPPFVVNHRCDVFFVRCFVLLLIDVCESSVFVVAKGKLEVEKRAEKNVVVVVLYRFRRHQIVVLRLLHPLRQLSADLEHELSVQPDQ